MSNQKRIIQGLFCATALIIITFGATLAFGTTRQDEVDEGVDRWAPFQYFVGEWTGSGDGLGGSATLTRSCEQILHDNFIFMKTQSIFPPQEANPNGEDHRDWGMISFDTQRERYILRQFFGEGFINQYTVEISEDGKKFVFTTEKIESYQPGWRVRLTFTILSENEYQQELELAPPDRDYFSCRKGTLSRKTKP